MCEESTREGRYDHQDDRFDMDDDVADDLRRDYGIGEEAVQSGIYWEGFNAARRRRFGLISCRFSDPDDRKEFYRGVSDARHRLR